jgi:hypothetical protein
MSKMNLSIYIRGGYEDFYVLKMAKNKANIIVQSSASYVLQMDSRSFDLAQDRLHGNDKEISVLIGVNLS